MRTCVCSMILFAVAVIVPGSWARSQTAPDAVQGTLFDEESEVVDYAPYEALLRKHVREGRIDYLAWKKEDMVPFEAYIRSLADCRITDLRSPDQKAFWINAYNALAVYAVLVRIPDNALFARFFSVKKTPGFFDAVTYRVAGETLTLNQIREQKLVSRFQDPRIHCVLLIPALGAPAAQNEVMRGEDVDDTIDYLVGMFLNDFRRNNLNGREGTLYLSELFSWYEKDFLSRKGATLVDFVIPFMTGEARKYLQWNKTLPVKYIRYNWSLNQAP